MTSVSVSTTVNNEDIFYVATLSFISGYSVGDRCHVLLIVEIVYRTVPGSC